MTRAVPAAVDAATSLTRALASAVQIAKLYPEGHPERVKAATDVASRALAVDREAPDRPLIATRGAFYVGSTLLAEATLTHGDLLETFEDVGLVSIHVKSDVQTTDAQALVAVLRGEQPNTTEIPSLALNHVRELRTEGAEVAASARTAFEIAAGFLAGERDRLADGRHLNLALADQVAERLADYQRADPSTALLLAALGGHEDALLDKIVKAATLVVAVARELGLPGEEVRHLSRAALLYDVGLLAIDPEALHQVGPLDAQTQELVDLHCEEGAAMLLGAGGRDSLLAAAVALEHHHSPDDDPCLPARIVAAADRYAALTTERAYRASMRPDQAMEVLNTVAGSELDRQVVAAVTRVLGPYPPGTVVRLASGETGVVVRMNRDLPTQPMVRVLVNDDGEPCDPVLRDCSEFDGFGFVYDIVDALDPEVVGLSRSAVRRGTLGGLEEVPSA